MELYKIDLAIFYDAEKIKEILKIIKENNNNIELIERELVEKGIFNATQEDFFLRNKATFLREFGVYDDNNNITDIGHLFLNGEIKEQELSLLFLVKHCAEINNKLIWPFEILIRISLMLKELYGNNKIYCGEFLKIMDNISDNSDETIRNAVSLIVSNRQNNFQYEFTSNEKRYYTNWKKVIVGSKLQLDINEPADCIDIDLNDKIIKEILNFYRRNEPSIDEYYKFNDPFIRNIKKIQKVNNSSVEFNPIRTKYEKFFPVIVYKYLFGENVSLRDLEKEITILDKSQSGDLAKNILNGLNIGTNGENKGIYAAYENFPYLVISKLKYSQDSTYKYIAEILEKFYRIRKGAYSMEKESILTKIKTKYFELENDQEYLETRKKQEEELVRFKNLFDYDHLKNMTLEEFDFPKTIDEKKYKNSLMYFVEKSCIGIPLGGQRNKLFFYDKSTSTEDNIKYNTVKLNINKYPNLSVEEIFEIYRDKIYQYVKNFDENEYMDVENILTGANVIQNQLIRFYYPNTIFGFTKEDIYKMMFNELNISDDMCSDRIATNLKLKKELIKQDEFFKEADMEILTEAIYKIWKEKNAEMAEYIIDTRDDNIEEIYNNIKNGLLQSDKMIEDIVEVLLDKKNIILTGTPGVGKTYATSDIIKLVELKTNPNVDFNELDNRIKLTQFHQSYGYEEFVEGMTLNNNILEPKIGKFKALVDDAKNDPNHNYYMIIDEINRGNISKIFGELLMCIESDKRSPKYSISLMYSDVENNSFYVPSNVYIIGTMNTADRSLAPVDYALRRRFSFFNLKPAFNTKKFNDLLVNCPMLNEINTTLVYINGKLEKYFNCEDFNIGHSYFISKNETINSEKFERILRYEIIPLIKEYMNDLEDREVYNKFKTENVELAIFNKLIKELVKENEIEE